MEETCPPSSQEISGACLPNVAFVDTHLDHLQAECIDMKRVLESMISANAECLNRLGLRPLSRPSKTISRQNIPLVSRLAQGYDWRLEHENLRLAHVYVTTSPKIILHSCLPCRTFYKPNMKKRNSQNSNSLGE